MEFNGEKLSEAMEFLGKRLREAFVIVGNLGGEVLAWFERVFPSEKRPEKIKDLQLAVQNSGEKGLAWLVKVCPPETAAEKFNHLIHISKPYLPAAAALVVVWMLFRFFSGGGSGKMMKAPGRNCRIRRADFESNPKDYFLDLRADK